MELNQSGQATTEYILLLAVVVSGFVTVAAGLNRMGLGSKLMKPLSGSFAATYRYGHPKATGFDDGTPKFHPRVNGGDNNFRLFLNPKI